VFSHIPKTIQDCTEKNVNIINAAIPNDILDLIDMFEIALIIYSSDFLNPHFPKNHLEGQNPVHTPTFNMQITKSTTPQIFNT